MNSFMKALYYGEISPWERDRPKDPEYTEITRKIIDIQANFRNTLSPKQWDQVEELGNLYAKSFSIENAEVFTHGLSIGILLMVDVLDFKDKLSS